MKAFLACITVFFTVSFVFPLAKRIDNLPMKTYRGADIPDGEFLVMGVYYQGEKKSDYYYVTRKIPDGSGGFLYRFYIDNVPAAGTKKYDPNYTNWPVSILIDPVRGQTVESEGNINTNDLEGMSDMGYGGLFYWHYRLFRDEGCVRYISKSVKGEDIITRSSMIKVKTGYPLADLMSSSLICCRLLDTDSPGVYYLVLPDFMKEPMPVTLRLVRNSETLSTKAGIFHVRKLVTIMADPFIGKLMGSFLKTFAVFVEDSDRRLFVKSEMQGTQIILEAVSNVNRNKL